MLPKVKSLENDFELSYILLGTHTPPHTDLLGSPVPNGNSTTLEIVTEIFGAQRGASVFVSFLEYLCKCHLEAEGLRI